MQPFSRPAGGYIPSLDGLRAVSIAVVALKHAFPALPMASGFGVTIFFFISGYLITTLLFREIAETGSIDFTSFYKRRVLRLGPPLVITMALGMALVMLGKLSGTLDPMILLSQLLFFFNYYGSGLAPAINGLQLLWSLSVEEHFYLFFPLLLLVSIRRKWGAGWLVWFALLVLIWRTIKFVYLGYEPWQIYSYSDTRIDSMLWGCALAVFIEKTPDDVLNRIAGYRTLLLLAGFALLGVSFVFREEIFRSTLVYTLRGIGLIPIFYFAICQPKFALFRPLNWGPIRKIGVYSYTIYLVHQVVIFSIRESVPELGEITSGLIGLGLAVVYAAMMYRFVERPIKVMRQRLHNADSGTVQSADRSANTT